MGLQVWLVELLAIKLYEHDESARRDPEPLGRRIGGWQKLAEKEREDYRSRARALREGAELPGDDGVA